MADSKEDESDDGLSGVTDFVQIYMIQCDIIAGHNLEKADGPFGKSDPYVKVSAFSTSYTTCTIMKTLNPQWNEHVEMTFFNDPKALKFEVWDWDRGSKDDAIGDCEFAIDDDFYSPTSHGFSGRLKLQNCKTGELEIKVVARKLVPSQLEDRLSALQDTAAANTLKMEGIDEEIAEFGRKNTALRGQMDGINAKIAGLKAAIPPRKEEELHLERRGETLGAEREALSAEMETVNEALSAVEDELKEATKRVEDVRVEEDRKYTEIERLRERIEDAKRRKEQQERAAAAEREAEQKRADDAKPLNDPSTPLVDSDASKPVNDRSGCCCVVL